jgi:hypothetical protein
MATHIINFPTGLHPNIEKDALHVLHIIRSSSTSNSKASFDTTTPYEYGANGKHILNIHFVYWMDNQIIQQLDKILEYEGTNITFRLNQNTLRLMLPNDKKYSPALRSLGVEKQRRTWIRYYLVVFVLMVLVPFFVQPTTKQKDGVGFIFDQSSRSSELNDNNFCNPWYHLKNYNFPFNLITTFFYNIFCCVSIIATETGKLFFRS